MSRPSRDRDRRGRPRNARPRDETGRPLPRAATGVERPLDPPALAPLEALATAQRLVDSGRPFDAHEVLEAVWKAAPEQERGLWRALAQLAVGLTHLQRGNAKGAVTLLRRGAAGLTPYAADPPYALDLSRLAEAAAELATNVENGGISPTSGARLRFDPGA